LCFSPSIYHVKFWKTNATEALLRPCAQKRRQGNKILGHDAARIANEQEDDQHEPQATGHIMSYGRFIKTKKVGDGYIIIAQAYTYTDPKTGREITNKVGMYSDGATWARDLKNTDAWLVHDNVCRYGRWDDGGKIGNWTASRILGDILKRDGHWLEAIYWRWGTFVLGGGAARINGMRIAPKSKKRDFL